MSDAFQALSSTTRRKILAYLSKAELTAGDIAARFEMSKPAMSKHLSILNQAGLVVSRKEGQFVYYSLSKENLFSSMNDFLVNFCPEGRPLKLESAEVAESQKKDG